MTKDKNIKSDFLEYSSFLSCSKKDYELDWC